MVIVPVASSEVIPTYVPSKVSLPVVSFVGVLTVITPTVVLQVVSSEVLVPVPSEVNVPVVSSEAIEFLTKKNPFELVIADISLEVIISVVLSELVLPFVSNGFVASVA